MTEILEAARAHSKALSDDLQYAQTRLEHIRISTLALQAERLVRLLEDYNRTNTE